METPTKQPTRLTTVKAACPDCHGTGTVKVTVRQKWGSSKNWCYTGHEVEHNYSCHNCAGTGKVAA